MIRNDVITAVAKGEGRFIHGTDAIWMVGIVGGSCALLEEALVAVLGEMVLTLWYKDMEQVYVEDDSLVIHFVGYHSAVHLQLDK